MDVILVFIKFGQKMSNSVLTLSFAGTTFQPMFQRLPTSVLSVPKSARLGSESSTSLFACTVPIISSIMNAVLYFCFIAVSDFHLTCVAKAVKTVFEVDNLCETLSVAAYVLNNLAIWVFKVPPLTCLRSRYSITCSKRLYKTDRGSLFAVLSTLGNRSSFHSLIKVYNSLATKSFEEDFPFLGFTI